MPTYQYACTNPEGKHEFEVVQSFTDAPVAECPTCGTPVRKVYGSVGVVFKGSGFYRTDSRSGSPSSKEPSKESAKEPAKAGASSDSSSSAKAAGSSSSSKETSSSSTSTGSAGSKAAAG